MARLETTERRALTKRDSQPRGRNGSCSSADRFGRRLFVARSHAVDAIYGASKAFVLSFAEAIHNEVKDTNVVITALQPGATDTDFFRRAHMEDTKVGAGKKTDPADVAKEGFAALMKGKDHVIAAMRKEKLNVALGHVMPDHVKAEQQRKYNEPGSASQ